MFDKFHSFHVLLESGITDCETNGILLEFHGKLRSFDMEAKWFFVRYFDQEDQNHLRLRVSTKVDKTKNALIMKYLRKKFNVSWRLSNYQPEYNRYGGQATMPHIESHFFHSSEFVISFLKSKPDFGAKLKVFLEFLLYMLHHQSQNESFTLESYSKATHPLLRDAKSANPYHFTEFKNSSAGLYRALAIDFHERTSWPCFFVNSKNLRDLFPEKIIPPGVCWSILHMFANRLGIHPIDESLLISAVSQELKAV